MSFELTIAAKRDPRHGHGASIVTGSAPISCTEIALNGTFDEAASSAVLSMVSDLAARDAESILIRMEEVDGGDVACFDAFAEGLMSLRASGTHVQVDVRHLALHEKMAAAARSRDWLVNFADSDASGPRKALHVDGLGSDTT